MALRVTKQVLECFGRAGAISKMTSLPASSAQFLLANWVNDIHVDTAYQTKISAAKHSLAEERRSLLSKPLRTQKVSYLSRDWAESARLIAALSRHTHNESAIPIYSDVSVVSSNTASTVVNCDTRYRRFFVGQQIAVVDPTVTAQYARIAGIQDDSLSLETSVTVNSGDLVFPLMISDITLRFNPSLVTDRVTQANATFDEVNDNRTLPGTWKGEIEGPFDYHDGYPILKTPINWADDPKMRIIRPGKRYGQGKGRIVSSSGPRSIFAFDLPLCFDTREEFWRHLNLFDSRQGRQRPFFVPAPHTLWQFKTSTVNDVDIVATAPMEDFEDFYDFIALELGSGEIFIRGISNWQDNGTIYTISLDSPLLAQEADAIARVTPAHLMRFESDEMSERWETNDTVLVDWKVIEVLNEGTYSTAVA